MGGVMSGLRQRRFRYVAVGLLSTGLLSIGSALAWADESITLDFVRHGETAANAQGIIDTQYPGDPLDPTGITQANDIAPIIQDEYGKSIAGIFSGDLTRTIQTAEPLANAVGMSDHAMAGLDEINAGIYEGHSVDSLAGILYLLTPMAWVFGLELAPMPGSPDMNGFVFDDRFTGAVDSIYNLTDPSATTNPADIAFSSEGAITTWTLMNVNNPDFGVVFKELLSTGQFLPNTGQVVLQGDPQDGWTLVSWDGHAVPQNPGLGTELFVDARNLIEAPQLAGWNFYEALLGHDPTTILSALETGMTDVGKAIIQFPISVFDDIVNSLTGGTLNLGADAATAATDAASLAPGELGGLVGDMLAAL